MTSPAVENVSVNSWTSMPKEKRTKIILQLQEDNNKMKLVIDDHQKRLVDLRCEVPEECREMFEEEKKTLLKHYTTAELFPILPKGGFGPEETDRMVNCVRDRVEAKVADCKETRTIFAATEQVQRNNEMVQNEILSLGDNLLRKLQK